MTTHHQAIDYLQHQLKKIMSEEQSPYNKLRAINVSDKIEKKGNLSYLSWAWAVDTLLQNDPNATWVYGEPVNFGETLMVFCSVEACGKVMTAQLPVMDHRNKAIANPDAFQVNVAMQRCLAKAIALHGIGLYIYNGEDLPEAPKMTRDEAVAKVRGAKSLDELKEAWSQIPVVLRDEELVSMKDDAKNDFTNNQ